MIFEIMYFITLNFIYFIDFFVIFLDPMSIVSYLYRFLYRY